MSFLKKLFGSAAEPPEPMSQVPEVTGEVEHKGFTIKAVPFKANGQFQTAGQIEKLVDGTLRSHRFIRADRSPSIEEVTSLALQKGQLMVDQMGESLFQA